MSHYFVPLDGDKTRDVTKHIRICQILNPRYTCLERWATGWLAFTMWTTPTPCLDVNCHDSGGRFWKLMSYFVLIMQPYRDQGITARSCTWIHPDTECCKRNTKFTASQMDSNCHTNLIELGLPEAFSHLKTSMNITWTSQYLAVDQNQSLI